jgi:hypothetical protein
VTLGKGLNLKGQKRPEGGVRMADDVTEPDEYLVTQALFFAAHFIDGLPAWRRPRSNRDGMIEILRAKLGDNFMPMAEIYSRVLQDITGRPFDVEDY